MRKMAIFVEGETEVSFTRRLIEELAGRNNVAVSVKKASGGSRNNARIYQRIYAQNINDPNIKYYFLITNSSNDERVKSDIKDNYLSLASNGYSSVIGLRDIYPQHRRDIPNLQKYRNIGIPAGTLPVEMIFAVMETEAWFIGEYEHYTKISSTISLNDATRELGFDPRVTSAEQSNHPASDLDKVYRLGNRRYLSKNKARIDRTVNALDYERLYLDTRSREPSLDSLINAIDSFLI